MVQAFVRNPNISIRDAAKKIGVSASYVQKTKKREGLITFKKQQCPNRDERQNLVAKMHARKLYTQLLTKAQCLVIDDETYVKADFKQLPGQEYYTAKDKWQVNPEFKQKKCRNLLKNS